MEQEEKKQKSQAAENQASCSSLQPVAPHPFISVIPLAVLITLIVLVVKIFPDDALAGASQVALMIATAVCVALGMGIYRMKWNIFEEMIKKTVGDAGVSILILLLIAALLFFLGMFMETLATIIILVPVLLPMILQLGIDPIHFGIVLVVTNNVAMLTPPLGVNLFVASRIAGISVERISVAVIPYLIALTLCILLFTYVPAISTWLPSLMGYGQ